MITGTRTITLNDFDNPVIVVSPVDTILECGSATLAADIATWVANLGGAVSTDNCATTLTETFVAGTEVEQCGGTSTTPYTYTVMDECGNETVEVAYLYTIDVTPPVAMCVAPFDLPLDENGQATLVPADINDGSTDLCSDASELSFAIAPSSFNELNIGDNTVELTVTDDCGNSSTCTTVVTVTGVGQLGLAKRIVNSEQNSDGSVNIIYEFNIENYGNVELDSLQLIDDLATIFTPCAVDVVALTSGHFEVNPGFNGISNTMLLTGNDDIAAGEKGAVLLEINVNTCGGDVGPFMNTALVMAEDPDGTPIEDISSNGSDPDTDGDGNPNDDNETTDITFDFESFIGLAKSLEAVVINTDGSVDVDIRFIVENYGNTDLDSINLFDDVAMQFMPCDVEILLHNSSPGFAFNTAYDGGVTNDTLLTGGANGLLVGESGFVFVRFRFTNCGSGDLSFCNQGFVTAIDPLGTVAFDDLSQSGTNPDPDGDGDPTNNDACTEVQFGFNPAVGIAKRVSEGPTSDGMGCFDVTYEIRVENYGDQEIAINSVVDDLSTTFALADTFSVISVESEEFMVNPLYDGVLNQNLVLGGDTLGVATSGDEGVIYLKVNVCPGEELGPYMNQATVVGVSLDGTPLIDASQDGSNPDPDNEGDATDNNELTPVSFEFNPSIGAAKRAVSVDLDADGCTEVVYEINIENFGDVLIDSVQVVDDLDLAGFDQCGGYTVTLTSDDFIVNSNYNGSTDSLLLTGLDDLPVGDVGAILLTVEACGCPDMTEITNSATVSGVTPAGEDLEDDSVDGSDPDGEDNDDNPDEDGETVTTLTEMGSIGAAKREVGVNQMPNGCTEVEYEFNIENFGNVNLDSVQLSDDLVKAGFSSCDTFYITGITSDDFTVNTAYDGSTDTLLLQGGDDLPVGDKGAILLKVEACGCEAMTMITNSSTVTANTPAGDMVSDESTDGSDPDGEDGDGIPDEMSTTETTIGEQALAGLAKRIVSLINNSDGSATVTYEFNVENFGSLDIDSLQVVDSLSVVFDPCNEINVVSITSDDYTVNGAYNGTTDNEMLLGDDVLRVNDKGAILLVVNIGGCAGNEGPFFNTAIISGNGPGGDMVIDSSQQGSDPDPDGDFDPTNNNDPTVTMFEFNSFIGLAKNLVSVVNNADASATVTFEFLVENFGDQGLSELQITDDLLEAFDPCSTISVIDITSPNLIVNDMYNGTTILNLLVPVINDMDPGEENGITLTVNVSDCNGATGPFFNTAVVTSLDESGEMVIDSSQNGTNPDPDGDGDPTDNNVPTPIDFEFNPGMGVSKRLTYGPILSTEGCYDIRFEMRVQNYGDVDLYDIQVLEDLDEVFGAGDIWSVISIESEEFEVNDMFDGIGNINLLNGNDTLTTAVGGNEGAIYLSLNVCPDGMTNPYMNTAIGTSSAPGGQMLQDSSQNGSNPDPDGDGDPTDNNDPTVFQLECEIPMFTNCPRPAINVDAPEGWCTAFVNFSSPEATAECGLDTIIQVDGTGLNSGELFPVGLTTLKWIAIDVQGNESDTCIIKIFVNDFHTAPVIVCPEDMTVTNDPFECGAAVDSLGLVSLVDNCSDNTAVIYEITDEDGNIVSCGMGDASDAFFPKGLNTLTYRVQDQPLLLITEVNQEGPDMIEITNFGPAGINVECLQLTRNASISDSIIILGGLVLQAGEVAVFTFATDIGDNDPAGYTISTQGAILDAVSLNGFSQDGFTGLLSGRAFYRNSVCDHDTEIDWTSAFCETSMGMLNPGLVAAPSNGTITSLQSSPPSIAECSVSVTVLDEETPQCAEYLFSEFTGATATIDDVGCGISTSTVTVAGINSLGTVEIRDLLITHPNVGDLTATLISPEGTRVELFDGLCATTADVNVSLSDTSAASINSAACTPLGSGAWYTPSGFFGDFYGEDGNGIWTLEVVNVGTELGSVTSWNLDILELVPYSQMDTTLNNDEGLCGAEFMWNHPVFQDNCQNGTITVVYTSEDGSPLPMGGVVVSGDTITEFFPVGTTTVTYTLTDASGNMNVCGFDVIVLDAEDPMNLVCPADMIIDLESGECCRVLNFPFPSVTDNCGIDTVIYSTGNNVEYCVGISEVTLTVFDAAGNMASCDFTVTVNPFIDEDDPITFICYGNVNLSLDGDCMSEITADLLINVGTHGCLDNYCIVTIDENGDTIPDNIVTLEHVGQQLEVSVIDCLGTGNSCWGIVNVENKIDPDLECPADITIDCLSDANDLNLTGTALLLTCETDYDLTYADLVSDLGECKEPRYSVVRTWTLVNDEGKRASCEQLISLRPFDFADLKWPANFTADSSLSCSEVAANPLLTEPASTGYPTINGENIFGDHYCDVYVGYWDEVLQDANCTSGYSILRHWIIQNACLPLEGDDNPVEYIQNIIVQDYTPPVLSAFKDVTISTDLWGCKAVYRLPIPEVTDNCSSQDQIKFTYSSIGAVIIDSVLYANKPIVGNTVEVTVWATDACKNTSSTSFKITVKDEIPPVVVADADLVVSLGADGLAKVRAISFDDGSFDGCGPVSYAVRRVDGGATCPILDESLPVGNDNEQLNEFVLFCCDDIGKDSLMVEFQVCDDANQDGILGGSGDLCNSVMVAVEVQDKLPPALLCPPPMTISCIDFYAVDLTDFARLDSLFGSADAFGSCSVIVTQSVLGDEFCGSGEIIRRIVATNDAGQNACNQTITVNAEVVNQLTCNRISFAALDNNIYSWCDVNDNGVESSDLPALEIDCDQDYTLPELKIDLDGLCTEAGVNITVDTFMFAGDACRKYLVHYEVIDQCIYKENYFNPATNQIDPFVSENGYFEFYIEIDAFDNEGPMLACEEVTIETQSCVGYDGAITIEATDKCTEAAFFGIQWKLDVNNDGTYDFPASGFATTREITPAQVGLELFPLGTHSVTWVFTDGCGNSTSCDQVITIEQSDKAPTPYCYGGIASTVLAEDGSYSIWAVDFDAGSADGCASDLVFSLLPETYAEGLSDDEAFNVSLTHPDVIKIDEGSYGFSLGCANIPNGVSAEIPVRMYVSNQKGSYDFCSSTLRLADNSDICEDVVEGALSISGQIKTEFGAKVDSVIMALDANFVEFPYFQNTDQNGTYLFRLLHSMIDYEVEPSKNYKHRNGVTTLDLVLLQRHILGIDRLTSPYKLIAGDVNSDCKISAQDLLQLRKLILGLYADDVLPHNQSWRFVAEDFAFQESEQPCSYEELSTMISMTTSSEEDFIGVKIGDVNNSVEVASRKDVAKRSKGSIDILVNDRVFKKGEEVQVDLYASDFSEVFGFQFSIGFENLLYSDMEAGQVDLNAQNLSERFIDADQLVFSYGAGAGISVANDSILFSLNFIATSDGLLSESLSMSDFRLNPEVYKDSDLSVYVPTLRFNTVDEETLVFDVSQNIPNPFIDRTKIGFTIPEQGDVTLTVLDIAGKKLLSKKKYCAVGENEFVLYRSEVDHSGVLYYQISIGDHIGGKTMIVINKE